MPEIFELFHSSFFIIPSMLPLWFQALDYFIQKRYSLFVLFLFGLIFLVFFFKVSNFHLQSQSLMVLKNN